MTRRADSLSSRTTREIELTITELVLTGFSPAERFAIGDALSMELERLMREGTHLELSRPADSSAKDRAVERLNGGTIALELNTRPGLVGMRVARAVYQSLNNSGTVSTGKTAAKAKS